MAHVVIGISQAMIAEPALPHGKTEVQLLPNPVGRAAFDVLNSPLQSCALRWGENDVKMIGHEHEGVELIRLLIAVMKQGFEENPTNRFFDKQRPALPGARGNEVYSWQPSMALGNRHALSG